MKLLGGEVKPGDTLTVKGDLDAGQMTFVTGVGQAANVG
jgi:Predicted ATPase or kinase